MGFLERPFGEEGRMRETHVVKMSQTFKTISIPTCFLHTHDDIKAASGLNFVPNTR